MALLFLLKSGRFSLGHQVLGIFSPLLPQCLGHRLMATLLTLAVDRLSVLEGLLNLRGLSLVQEVAHLGVLLLVVPLPHLKSMMVKDEQLVVLILKPTTSSFKTIESVLGHSTAA